MTSEANETAEQGREARDLGAMAEKLFAYFASQVRLVPSRPDQDVEGWDLSSDLSSAETDPWGLPIAPLICRFQVKATRTGGHIVRLKRANVLRMVQQPIPWFLLFVRYTGDSPETIQVVHIDDKLVEAVLTWAVREPDSSGFQLDVDRGISIESNAHKWRASLEELIGNKGTYFERKRDWIQRAGRTGPAFRFNMEVRGATEEDYADFFLGLRSTLPVHNFSVFEERFGSSRLRRAVGAAEMSLPSIAPVASATLTARGPNRVASAECRLYSAWPWLPRPSRVAHKLRLQMTYFDMIIGAEINDAGLSLNFPPTIDLSQAAKEARFFEALHGAEELMLTCRGHSAPLPVYKFEWTSNEAGFLHAVMTTHQLVLTLGMKPDDYPLSRLLHGQALDFALAVLGHTKSRLVSLTMNRSTIDLPSAILYKIELDDGSDRAGLVIRLDGAAVVNGSVVFEIKSWRTIDRYAFASVDADASVRSLLKRIADKIEKDEGILVDYLV